MNPTSSPIEFTVAGPEYDAEIRRLLRQTPIPGAISLTLEREPDFFLSAGVEGDDYYVGVGRTQSGEVVALGGMAAYDAWINGEVCRLGYLTQLRIAMAHRGNRTILAGLFAMAREHYEMGVAPLFITTVIEANAIARRVLEKERPFKPSYKLWGVFSTLALPLWRRHPQTIPRGVSIHRATSADLPRIADFLQRTYSRFQFAPQWTVSRLEDSPRVRDLDPDNFLLALRGETIMGCLAIWDQQAYKQTVLHGYTGTVNAGRRLYNLASPILGWPPMPGRGERLNHAFISHIAIEDEHAEVFIALMTKAYGLCRQQGYLYLTLGLDERHPLLSPLKASFFHVEYRAILYVVYWPEGRELAQRLNTSIPHVELAML